MSLLALTMRGEFVVTANVLAGSGARYAGAASSGGKGRAADLYDLMQGENAKLIACGES